MSVSEITADHFKSIISMGHDQAIHFLASFYRVERGAIRSRLRRAGVLPQCGSRREMIHPQNVGCIPGEEIVARRVDRDPCPRCAVRRDIGCRHRPTIGLTGGVFG
jgi:hypothetical protein